jgi:phage FluMu protein Com
MAYPFQAQASSSPSLLSTKPTTLNPEWRCTRCNKLLGVCRDGRMHLRVARGHEYFAGFPVQAICRGCRTLNQASNPTG